MLGKFFKTGIGATTLAVAMAFSALSAHMPGNVALAEEDVNEIATDTVIEDAVVAEEVDESITTEETSEGETESALVESAESSEDGLGNITDDEDEFVTVSGNIIGYEYDEPFEILFDGRSFDDKYDVVTVAQDGRYSAKLYKNVYYIVRLPGADGYCLNDPDNEGIILNTTSGKDFEFDISINMLSIRLDGRLDYGDLKNINGGTWNEEDERIFDGSVITFESKDNIYTDSISWGEYGISLPKGEYTVTLSGKTGNVYSVEPFSAHWENGGYVDYFDWFDSDSHTTSVYYGDYRTRDDEARIVCNFKDTLGLDLSNTKFYFEDSDKNRTNDCSYYEIIYGLIRLPENKAYKLVASGLPEGYELDYGKMGTIFPLKGHCGDGRYDYTVAIKNTDNTADDEDKFVTVSGNIIGYEYDEPFNILFEGRGGIDENGESFANGDEVAVAQDGRYSVKLSKNAYYLLRLPNVKGFCLYDPDNEGITMNTFRVDNELQFDIRIHMLSLGLDGTLDYGDIRNIKGDSWDYTDEKMFDGSTITFESEDNILTDEIRWGEYSVSLPHGEYIATLKGKTGNVYSVVPYSVDLSNEGYVNSFDWVDPKHHTTSVYYGDYRTRDDEARIVCRFEDTLGLDLSNTKFYFEDSGKKRTNDCSYNEIIYGLIRLPKDKTYKLVASGLPEGYELDYGKMGTISPLKEHCGDGRYDYTVAIKKADPYKPLAIVNDTEDIVAKNGSKITFRIEAEGTDLKYSWYYKKPGADKYTKAGVYTNEYTRTASKSTDGMQAYCMVSDSKGKKVHGRVATFSLDKQIEISYPNGKSISATKGKKVDFMIYATSDMKLSYSWYYMVPTTNGGDGKYHKAGCYTDTYTRTAGNKIDGMQAYCLITDSAGHQVKSDVITFTLK